MLPQKDDEIRQPQQLNAVAEAERDYKDHTPLLAMWYQTRAAVGEAIIPLLAGLKTAWLVVFVSRRFFRAEFNIDSAQADRGTAQLFSPFDLIWRTFTKEARTPLGPAKLLIFAIVAMVLVEQGLQVGQDVGVLAGIDEAIVQQATVQSDTGAVVELEPEVSEAVADAIEAGVQAGIQVANAEAVQEALAETEIQEATEATEAQQDSAPSLQSAPNEADEALQPESVEELTDAAVTRGVESVNVDALVKSSELESSIESSAVDPEVIKEIIREGIETGITTGVQINAAWEQSGSLLQRVVGLALQSLPPALGEQVAVLQGFYTVSIRPFLDQAFISTVLTLIRHLLSVMVFAYIFDILVGRAMTAVQSYTFWLYLEAVKLLSVAVYFAVFQLFPNLIIPIQQMLTSFFGQLLNNPLSALLFETSTTEALGIEANAAAFWFLENGFHSLLWLYVFPMFLLPRLFPALNARGVLLSTFMGRLIYLLLGAITLFGLVALFAYIGM